MKARTRTTLGLTLGALALAAWRVEGQAGKTSPGTIPARSIPGEPPPQKVRATDIGKRVQIIGRLGYPLGELITVQGTWRFPRSDVPVKDNSPSFIVTSVNGKNLETPVLFEHFQVSRAWGAEELPEREGQVWEVRGCETGGFLGTPPDVWDDATRGPNQPPVVAHPPWAYGFKFNTDLLYSSWRKGK